MFGKIKLVNKQLQDQSKQKIDNQRKDVINLFTDKSKKIKKIKKKPIGQKVTDLSGSKFRILNELLYTSTSKQAYEHFKQHQEDYQVYHQGYRKQSQGWTQKPVNDIIQWLSTKQYKNSLILDLGCGEGFIEQQLASKGYHIESFDLVSCKPYIKVADIANLPISSHTKDVAIFCLSLMGTNYIEFIIQARRVLKDSGQLIIAEVESRCDQWKDFTSLIQNIGFKLVRSAPTKYFRIMHFKCSKIKKINGKLRQVQVLKPCIYKKR